MLIDTHVTLCPDAAAGDLAAHQAALGADEVWSHGNALAGGADCIAQNDRALALTRAAPSLRAFCALHPNMGNSALAELDRCLDEGMLGAGEFHPAMQGFKLDDPAFLAIAERLQERGAMLSLYLEFPVGAAQKAYPIRGFADFIERYSRLRVILTCFGGGLPFYELMREVEQRLANVSYDTAPSPRPLREIALDATAMITTYDKLIYGSGARLGSCPSPVAPMTLEQWGVRDGAALAALSFENALRLRLVARH